MNYNLQHELSLPYCAKYGPPFYHDFLDFVKKTNVCNFADGGIIFFYCANSIAEVILNLTRPFYSVVSWFRSKLLPINPSKLPLIIVCFKLN